MAISIAPPPASRASAVLGVEAGEAAETIADVRRRDEERLAPQITGGINAGKFLLRGSMQTPQPTRLVKPQREGQPLNEEAADILDEAAAK